MSPFDIHVSEHPDPIPLANGAGVLCRTRWSVSHKRPWVELEPEVPFLSREAAVAVAEQAASKLRNQGIDAAVRMHA